MSSTSAAARSRARRREGLEREQRNKLKHATTREQHDRQTQSTSTINKQQTKQTKQTDTNEDGRASLGLEHGDIQHIDYAVTVDIY